MKLTKRVVTCPTCNNPNVPVVAIGATYRYGSHVDARTGIECETFGAGIGSHNLAKARDVK